MSEKISFGEAIIQIAMRDLSKENGSAVFDKMLTRAFVSNVPPETNSAIQNLLAKVKTLKVKPEPEERCIQVALMLFQKEFTNPRLASYAVIYAQTMSNLKTWSSVNTQVEGYSDLQRKLTNALTRIKNVRKAEIVEKYANKIEIVLTETKPLVQELTNLAISDCGNLVMLEEMGRKRTFPAGISEKLSGGGFTDDDLTIIRDGVEEYFCDPKKVSRIKLIANSKR